MAYKKKKTYFYAGSQKLPDPKAETHYAPPGYNTNKSSTAADGGSGGVGGSGYKFSKFQRYNNNDEDDAFNSEPAAAVIPLDKKKKVTVRSFRGIKLVDIREFYQKKNDDGMQQDFPGKKGISLTEEVWTKLLSQAAEINEALKKLDSPGNSSASQGPASSAVDVTSKSNNSGNRGSEDRGIKRSNEEADGATTKKAKKETKKIKDSDLVDSEIESEEEREILQSNHPIASSAVKPTGNAEEDSSDDDSEAETGAKDDDDDAAAALEAAMLEGSDDSEED